MNRRIDRDDLMNPTVLALDDIGNDWHVRLGTVTGKPFTFVTPLEAADIGLAWLALAIDLAASEEWSNDRHSDLIDHILAVLQAQRVLTVVPERPR